MFAGPIQRDMKRHLDASGCPAVDVMDTEARARRFQKYFSEFSTNPSTIVFMGVRGAF